MPLHPHVQPHDTNGYHGQAGHRQERAPTVTYAMPMLFQVS